MQSLLDRPGLLKSEDGGLKLRDLYVNESAHFDARKLNHFAFQCYLGNLDLVQRVVESGLAPDLTGTETPYKFGYATLVVSGAQRVQLVSPSGAHSKPDHTSLLKYLLSRGTPPDVEDIVGYTALHHATMNANAKLDLARTLLENGANVNHRNKYGEVPLFGCFQTNQIGSIELLMELGASLDIPEADGIVPREFFLKCGPQVTAAVTKWSRKRTGEEAPLEDKKCNACGKESKSLKQCGKCHSARYCSVGCQKTHWPTHKRSCQPFTADNTVTLKPFYHSGMQIMSTSDHVRSALGLQADQTPPKTQHRGQRTKTNAHSPSQPKSLIIKVQGPMVEGSPQPLLVYNKKRDFVCMIMKDGNEAGYRRICDVIRSKGVGGLKVYFAAELKTRAELVVKVGEVLAEQPF